VRPATTLVLALILVALFTAVIIQFVVKGGPGTNAGTTTSINASFDATTVPTPTTGPIPTTEPSPTAGPSTVPA
jgi:hypothetical protein